MELIPAIDILNNIVVHGQGGERKKYKPIKSKILTSSNLQHVIEMILKEYNFKTIYLADLNSIAKNKDNFKLIEKTLKKFPKIDFWIDFGIKSLNDFKKIGKFPFTPIIGTESIENIKEFKKILKKFNNKIVLSLDYKKNKFLGPKEITNNSNFWPTQIILMFLDKVGLNKGPNFIQIEKIIKNTGFKYYLGGGIRNNKDIFVLKSMNINGVLLSTAIHKRKIRFENL